MDNGIATFDSINLLANYIPTPGFIGIDSFEYEFCHGIAPVRSLCSSSIVYVTVLPLPENCMNAVDDDGDGLADCDDPDCIPTSPTIQRKQEGLWWMMFLIGIFFFNYQLVKRQSLDIK